MAVLPKDSYRAKPEALKRAIAILALGMISFVVAGVAAGLTLIDSSDETVESLVEIVTAVAAESTEVTNQFLGEAEASGRMGARAVDESSASIDSPTVEITIRNVVASHDSIDGGFVALPNGDFLFVAHSTTPGDDGFRIKRITNTGGLRSVIELQTDSSFSVLESTELLSDTYEARSRPWYVAALERGRGWTDPYVFASSGQPGITHYQAVRDDAGETVAVIGIDVRLNELSEFLADRSPSEGGQALIIADDGSVIAGPANSAFTPSELQQLAKQSMGLENGAAVVSEWTLHGELHVAAVARIGGDDQWTLAVLAPEDDFLQGIFAQTDRIRILLPLVGLLVFFGVAMLCLWAWRRVDRLHADAVGDPLTGILNRNAVRDRLADRLDEVEDIRLAAVSIDLDDFGQINGTWGHDVGDAVLVTFTTRLVNALGDRGFAGRLGGDEFLVVLEIPEGRDVVTVVSELADTVLATPITTGKAEIDLSMSCGVAVREPYALVGLVSLLRQSDLALLTAKGHKPKVALFDPDMVLPSLRDEERGAELQKAIDGGEFEFHFQPEVDLSTGRVIGAEALMRWRKLDGSLPVAESFIADLERLGLVDLLTVDLVNSSAALASRIIDPGFTMRLNLSATQLRNHNTLDMIGEAARQDPQVSWCIEITERTIVETNALTLRKLEHLVEEGVQLALDDFGTGYSSFAELANLPITTIKIDRSFIDTLDVASANSSLASVINDMADRLSLDVVAEGIENQEQWDALSMIGCGHGQGYLFGKAMPMEEFLAASAQNLSMHRVPVGQKS